MTTTTPTGSTQLSTRVEDMPPLHVTTSGIPADEHVGAAPSRGARRRSSIVVWVVAGFIAVFAIASALLYQPPGDLHMGLSPYAWSQYRAGERVAPVPTVVVTPTPEPPLTVVLP
jgi:hypothetical protein